MTTVGYRIVVIFMVATVMSMSAGCGQKGDLYLPDKSEKQQDFFTREKQSTGQ